MIAKEWMNKRFDEKEIEKGKNEPLYWHLNMTECFNESKKHVLVIVKKYTENHPDFNIDHFKSYISEWLDLTESEIKKERGF